MNQRNNLSHQPSHPFPSGRYTHTNPLRREFGLQTLTKTLPKPISAALFHAWRHPTHRDSNRTIQSVGAYHQRPNEDSLLTMPPRMLDWLTLIELGVSRRILEAPIASISRETRNRLLTSQGIYLNALYHALRIQLGSAEAATAHILRAIDTIH